MQDRGADEHHQQHEGLQPMGQPEGGEGGEGRPQEYEGEERGESAEGDGEGLLIERSDGERPPCSA